MMLNGVIATCQRY